MLNQSYIPPKRIIPRSKECLKRLTRKKQSITICRNLVDFWTEKDRKKESMAKTNEKENAPFIAKNAAINNVVS